LAQLAKIYTKSFGNGIPCCDTVLEYFGIPENHARGFAAPKRATCGEVLLSLSLLSFLLFGERLIFGTAGRGFKFHRFIFY
jgi:hypothetical protein